MATRPDYDDAGSHNEAPSSSDNQHKSSSESNSSSSSSSDSGSDSDADTKPASGQPAAQARASAVGKGKGKAAVTKANDIPEEFLRRGGRDRKQVEQMNLGDEEGSSEDDEFGGHRSSDDSDSDGGYSDEKPKKAPRRKGKKGPAGPKAKPKKKKPDSEEDDNMYDFHQAGSDVEEDIFEDSFVKLEWDMGRDGDKVERVLDHRNIAVEGDEGVTVREYKVKWKCWSHLHNSYHTLADVSKFVDGKEQVDAYEKKHKKVGLSMRGQGFDEKEEQAIRLEEAREQQAQWVRVERVLDHRFAAPTSHNPQGCDEYLVKWRLLDYDEISWEEEEDIEQFQDEIENYKQRVRNRPSHPAGGTAGVRQRSTYKELATQPSYLEGGELRDYQLTGLNWMARQWHRNNSPILADEMGLGKTIQTISFLGYLQYGLELPGPFLVVVPLSTMGAWLKEFAKWCPQMNVVSYSGSKLAREKIQECEFYGKGQGKSMLMFNALVTTYEYVLRDAPMLGKIKWTSLLVDEAHRLKNDASQLFKAMNDFKTDHRLLITGTPLQNTLRELWCLLFFLDRDTFGDFDDFEEEFSRIKDPDPVVAKRTVGHLHTKLKDYMIRRVKRDVEKSLPNKIEQILRVEMSVMQRRYYKWILSGNFEELNRGLAGNEKSSLSNIIMELKKCCNHPYLFDNAENPGESNKVYTMIHASGKLALLDKLLLRLREDGHRVLIFSQMVRMLDILSDYLLGRKMKHQRLDGSTSHLQRQRAMEQFNAPDSPDFVFLLSTRAGGLGINLTSADTVIIYDSDWNPQNDLQAQSRAHRIGQTKTVRIYRLTTKDTVEEDILNRAKNKMVLNHLVISQANKKDNSFTQKELAQITKFGAADLFKKTDSEAEPQNDLDAILNKAEDVDFEGATQSSNEDLLGAFAVADVSTLPDPEPVMPDPKWDDLADELKGVVKPQQYDYILHPDDQAKKLEAEALKAKAEKEVEESHKKRRNPQQRRGFSGQHKKAFVEAINKFGDFARIKEMLLFAKVDELIVYEAEALAFGQQVIRACKEVIENPPEEEPASDDDDDKPIGGADGEGAPKKAASKTPKATIDGISVNAPELLFKVDALTCLNKVISKLDDPMHFKMCHMDPPQWAKHLVDVGGWDSRDDNRVLIGIWKHGFGTWEYTLREDPSLKLEGKIVERSSKDKEARARLASKNKLERRTKQLLLDLLVDVDGYDVQQPYLKMVQQLSRGAPKATKHPKEPRGHAGIGKVKLTKAPKEKKERVKKPPKLPKQLNLKKLEKLCKSLMGGKDGESMIAKLEKAGTYEDSAKKLERTKKSLTNLGQYIDSYIKENQQPKTLEREFHYNFPSGDLELGLWQVASERTSMSAEITRDLYKKINGREPGPVKDTVRKRRKSSSKPSKPVSSGMKKLMARTETLHGGVRSRPPPAAANRSAAAPHRKRSLSPAAKRPPGARGPSSDVARGVKRPYDGHEERAPKKRSADAQPSRGGEEDGEISGGAPPRRRDDRHGGDRRDDRHRDQESRHDRRDGDRRDRQQGAHSNHHASRDRHHRDRPAADGGYHRGQHDGHRDRPPRSPGYGDRPPRSPGYGDRPPRSPGYGDRPPRSPGYGDRPPRSPAAPANTSAANKDSRNDARGRTMVTYDE